MNSLPLDIIVKIERIQTTHEIKILIIDSIKVIEELRKTCFKLMEFKDCLSHESMELEVRIDFLLKESVRIEGQLQSPDIPFQVRKDYKDIIRLYEKKLY